MTTFRDLADITPTDRLTGSSVLDADRTFVYAGTVYALILDSETKRMLRCRTTGDVYKFQRAVRTRLWVGNEVGEWHYLGLALANHASRDGWRGSTNRTKRWNDLRAYALGRKPTPDADVVAVRDIQAERLKDERRKVLAREIAQAMNASEASVPAGVGAGTPLAEAAD